MKGTKKLKELLTKAQELEWEYDIYHSGKRNYVELSKYSPAGEDFSMIIDYENDNPVDSFLYEILSYAEHFDVEEHAEMWIPSKGKNGVPESVQALLDDAQEIKEMVSKLAKRLEAFEEMPDLMDRQQFYDYIMKDFHLDGVSSRLLSNILYFVEKHFPDKEKQRTTLHELLDGTIGLTETEIDRADFASSSTKKKELPWSIQSSLNISVDFRLFLREGESKEEGLERFKNAVLYEADNLADHMIEWKITEPYYDPEEDKRCKEEDACTGWWH